MGKLRDAVVLLVWAVIVTSVFLTVSLRVAGNRVLSIDVHGTETCMGALPCMNLPDFTLILVAAIGAGVLLENEKLVAIGFIIVHVIASVLLAVSLTLPVLLNLTYPAFADIIVTLSILTVFALQFPVTILLSMMGCFLGAFLGSRLE